MSGGGSRAATQQTSGAVPSEGRVRANGVELAFFAWGAPAGRRDATILLAHATGFHARCWDAVVRRLGDQHVIAVDQRGHGRSEKPPITRWEVFGRDLVALVRELGLRDVVGVGHSMGGCAMVEAAAVCPDRFRSLVLIDPVIAAPEAYEGGGWKIPGVGEAPHPTAKRRRHFDSPEEMFERFCDRVPYNVFQPEALRDYCVHGLLPEEDGDGYTLACPPEIEASVYMAGRNSSGVFASARALEIPVLILRAKLPPAERDVMDFSSSPTWPGLVGEFRRGREIHFPEATHFLPMESPGRVAELILAEVGRGGASIVERERRARRITSSPMVPEQQSGFCIVGSFLYPHEAHVARALLESEGIHALVLDEHHVQIDWWLATALRGVKVAVNLADADRATALLEGDHSAALREIPEQRFPPPPEERCARCGAVGLVAARKGVLPDPLQWLEMLFFLMLGGLVTRRRVKLRLTCRACGHVQSSTELC